jgi:hypothetical protein
VIPAATWQSHTFVAIYGVLHNGNCCTDWCKTSLLVHVLKCKLRLHFTQYRQRKVLRNFVICIALFECGKNKSNENFKTAIASKNYHRPKTTGECEIF